MTVSAGDALPFPVYAGRFRVVFPLLDADGDLVTGASTPDSERSIDMGTFADCTNEMVEIASGSGMYYLDLTAAEMTCSCLAIIAKSATAGAKTTPMVLYPRRFPVLRAGTAQAGAASTITLDSGASAIDDYYNGSLIQCSNNSPANVQGQTRWIIDYVGSTKVATVNAAWGTNPSSATTFEIYVPETANQGGLHGAETNMLTASLPVAHVSGINTDVITSSVLAASAVTEIQSGLATSAALSTVSGLVDDLESRLGTPSNLGSGATVAANLVDIEAQTDDIGAAGAGLTALGDTRLANLDATVSSRLATAGYTAPPTAAVVADAVWDEDATAHQTQGTFGQAIGDPAADTDTIWGLVNTNLNATVSSRASQTSVDTVDDFLDTEIAGIVTTLGIAGAGLTAIPWNAAWDAEVQSEATDALNAYDPPTKAELDSAVAPLATQASVTAIDDFVDTEVGAIKTVTDKLDTALELDGAVYRYTANALEQAPSGGGSDPWATTLPGAYGAGTAGKIVGDNINATISSRATPAQVNTEADTALSDVGLTSTITGRIDAAISSRLATASYTTPPTAAAVADQVWDEALAGHLGAGSTGTALNAAGAAGDPWSTALPGAYGAGTAGKIVGDNLDAAVSSRLATGGYTAPDNSTIATIVAKTALIPAAPAAVGDIPTALQNADALLDRADAIETGWTLRRALRIMAAALGGKLSGAATATVVVRDITDSKARITAQVDSDGNRSSVTLDGS